MLVTMFFSNNKNRYELEKLKSLIFKYRIVMAILSMSVLVLLQLYPNCRFSKNNPTWLTMYAEDKPEEPLVYTCCVSATSNKSIKTNVYFLKTHKTGGTTVQSVIMRFAMMNSLDVMSTDYKTYYKPFSDSSIRSDLMTQNNKYNIFASHMRYDSKMKSYQYPDTPMVTILRHPASLFQSLYTFFRMDRTTGMKMQQFINAPRKPAFLWGIDSAIAYRGYNQMSVDLGFNLWQKNNETAVAKFLEKIDREFDFVMITEYMEESMVLFANLMGWPLEYVAFLKINARVVQEDSYTLTEEDKTILMDLNEIDTVLYNYFLKKFLECKRQYGEDRLNTEVKHLKIINEQFKQRCVAEEVTGLNIGQLERIEYVAKNKSDLECFYSIHVSPVLSKMVQNAQTERLNRMKKK